MENQRLKDHEDNKISRKNHHVADADSGQISSMSRLCRGLGVLGHASMEAFPLKGQSYPSPKL
jgi:hypothetical protein